MWIAEFVNHRIFERKLRFSHENHVCLRVVKTPIEACLFKNNLFFEETPLKCKTPWEWKKKPKEEKHFVMLTFFCFFWTLLDCLKSTFFLRKKRCSSTPIDEWKTPFKKGRGNTNIQDIIFFFSLLSVTGSKKIKHQT